MVEEMSIRLARPEDYDDVMAIQRSVARGADYLPYMYHELVDDPKMFMCVAEMDGKLVSLSSIRLILNGEACFDFMALTNPIYQKRGIFPRLRQHKIDLFLHQYPDVTSVLFTGVESLYFNKRLQEKKVSLLARVDALRVVSDTSVLRQELEKVPSTPNDTERPLTPDLVGQLDIGGVVGVDYFITGPLWTPRRPNKSELLEALEGASGLVTLGPTNDEPTTSRSNEDADGRKQTVALSLFYPKSIQDNRPWHFNFFGRISCFLQHFSKQLQGKLDTRLSSEREHIIYVYFSEENNVYYIKGILQNYACQELSSMKILLAKQDISGQYRPKL